MPNPGLDNLTPEPRYGSLISSVDVALGADIAALDARLDTVEAAIVPWTAFTPTVTQGVAVTVTVNRARYQRVGTTIHLEVYMSVTGAGTAGQPVVVNVPSSTQIAGTGSILNGSMMIGDSSAATNYVGAAWGASSTGLAGVANGSGGLLGASVFTAALAAGDTVRLSASYEGA